MPKSQWFAKANIVSHSRACALAGLTLLQAQICSTCLSRWGQWLPEQTAATSWQIRRSSGCRPSSASTFKASLTSHLLIFHWPKHIVTKPEVIGAGMHILSSLLGNTAMSCALGHGCVIPLHRSRKNLRTTCTVPQKALLNSRSFLVLLTCNMLSQGLANFLYNEPTGNTLSFVGCIVFVMTLM
jgi:hypothetical protein